MKQKIWLALMLVGGLFTTCSSDAESVSLFVALGEAVAGDNVQARDLPLSDDVGQWKLVALNPDVVRNFLLSVGDAIDLPLFDREYMATVDRVVTNAMGTISLRARIDGYTYGYMILSTSGQESQGVIRIPEKGETYRIQTIDDPLYSVLMQIDPDKVQELELRGPLIPPPPKEESPEILRMEQFQQEPLADPMAEARIDVMVVYTEAAMRGAGGSTAINNLIAQGMETGQLTLDNSDTLISINLVYSGLVEYEETGNSSDDLRRLTSSPTYDPWPEHAGFMDIVHEWRDQYRADLVALLTETGDSGGVAWLLNNQTGRPDMGFSVTRRSAAGGMTFIHELGHNMGAHHHKAQNFQPGPTSWSNWSANQWSAGWRWVGNDSRRYCSVMTYTHGSYFPDGMTHERVPYFSNPNITHQGVATGHAVDGDNARTLREIRHVVAAYRAGILIDLQPQGRKHSFREASAQTISVTANTPWTATSDVAWITVVGGRSGNGNGIVTYNVDANDGPERSGGITVSGGGVSRTFSILQDETSIPLEVALDSPDLIWTTGGDAVWIGQTRVTVDGEDAAKSGTIAHNQSSWMETVVEGPGEIGFWWRVSSEMHFDFLEFYINGVRQDQISGEAGWEQKSYIVGDGSQTLRWRYVKDHSLSRGEDSGWVDQVSWVPGVRTPLLIDGCGMGAGGFEVRATGSEGTTVVLEFRTNLVHGFWMPVRTNQISGGVVEFNDLDADQEPQGFYRIRMK